MNQMYCGHFTDPEEQPELPSRNDSFFEIRGRRISYDTLMYSIGKLDKRNYLELWNKIYTAINTRTSDYIMPDEIDSIIKSDKNYPLGHFVTRMQLSLYSSSVPSFWANIYLKRPIDIRFHPGASSEVEIKEEDIDRLLGIIKKGYGVVFEYRYPLSLLFTFYFLRDFAASFAIEDNRKESRFEDAVSAFVLLNSTAKFPRVIPAD